MKKFKMFFLATIAILLVLLMPSSSQANNCSLCGKKIYVGSQCAGCSFNQFVNKLAHPCKICGQNIFFGKLCRSCKEKQSDSQKVEKNIKNDNAKNNKVNNNEENPSRFTKMWNSITTSTNNFYRRIFGMNKHD
ncbi:MAG TPA: hypothetical protein PKK26_12640 [Candidatus Wallbacteria bacterium]|nr:hypothetical protein [Candidatus Wallbacteria bacterium]